MKIEFIPSPSAEKPEPERLPAVSPYEPNVNPLTPFAIPKEEPKIVPIGAPYAVQMAAISGGEPGSAIFTFQVEEDRELDDLFVECEAQEYAFIKSIEKVSLTQERAPVPPTRTGIQPASFWSAKNALTHKLAGQSLQREERLEVVVCNLSTASNWAIATLTVRSK